MPKRKNRKSKLIRAPEKPQKKKDDQVVKTKKLRKITPTFKQRISFEKLVELSRKEGTRRNITLAKLLKSGGYAPSMVDHPSRVTKSKGWLAMMDKYFPDDKIAKAEKGQLNASSVGHYVFPAKEKDETIKEIIENFPNCKLIKIRKQLNWKRAYFSSPDNTAIGKSLDRIYKMKKRYPKEDQDQPIDIKIAIVNYGSK